MRWAGRGAQMPHCVQSAPPELPFPPKSRAAPHPLSAKCLPEPRCPLPPTPPELTTTPLPTPQSSQSSTLPSNAHSPSPPKDPQVSDSPFPPKKPISKGTHIPLPTHRNPPCRVSPLASPNPRPPQGLNPPQLSLSRTAAHLQPQSYTIPEPEASQIPTPLPRPP